MGGMKNIWLIHASAQGVPDPGSLLGHFVLRSDEAMPADNQMHDGGQYPDYDCAIGCIRSIVVSENHPAPNAAWCEAVAHTEPPNGTTWQGVEALLNALNIKWSYQYNQDPPTGWIMNPAWGGVLSPIYYGPYFKASQHEFITILDVPPPPPVATKVDMLGSVYYKCSDGWHRAMVDDKGTLFDENIANKQSHQVATGLAPFGVTAAIEVSVEPHVQRISTIGTLGDQPEYEAVNGTWERVGPYSSV